MKKDQEFIRRFAVVVAVLVCACAGAQTAPFAGLPVVGDRPLQVSQKFTFAILGDKTSGGEGKWPIFDRAVDSINLLKPDFVITVGDQIPGHMEERAQWDAEWKEYMAHARRLDMPLLLIPGNHDIANVECYGFWKKDFGPTYYAFDHKGCHFLVLNTEEERFDGRGPIWQAMMTFAEKDLETHRDAIHTFVFFHKPMWDDPRFTEDWKRIEKELAGRKFTAVAGHEHYLMMERKDDNLLVLQSGTGAGIALSNVKKYGAFHSFGYVTVADKSVTYAVVEPEGGIWPVDVAPASFRKAIAYDVVQLDADPPDSLDAPTVTLRSKVKFHNVLSERITVEVTVGPLDVCGWEPVVGKDGGMRVSKGKLVFTQSLEPGQETSQDMPFRVAQARLAFPPRATWRVKCGGDWVQNESYPMERENIVPIYPVACMRSVPAWEIVGPFPIGDIDTKQLPKSPAAANPKFFERVGPEDGYDPERVYEGGRKWLAALSVGRGLLNFNALMGTLDHALAYASCGVYSPKEQRVRAVIGADNYAQVVLNGQLVEEGQNFGAPGGFTYVPLQLKGGWNTLIVKLFNNRGDWFVRVLVADPEGNLKFAQTPGDAHSP